MEAEHFRVTIDMTRNGTIIHPQAFLYLMNSNLRQFSVRQPNYFLFLLKTRSESCVLVNLGHKRTNDFILLMQGHLQRRTSLVDTFNPSGKKYIFIEYWTDIQTGQGGLVLEGSTRFFPVSISIIYKSPWKIYQLSWRS